MAKSHEDAVVLLSGGLDSTTCLAIAKSEGYRCHALSFRYGQRHSELELCCAKSVSTALGAEQHLVIDFDMRRIGGSALTDEIAVPKGRSAKEIGDGVPVTYVPARNTIFLSFALSWAEVLGSTDIFIGVNALDYSGYPDCRPEFIEAFETLADKATRAGAQEQKKMRIHAPLMRLDKAQIIQRGIELGIDYGMTHSCYDPAADGRSCGECDACLLRRSGFAAAGEIDPLEYVVS
jgi:7-cyano-7-deazaguanine synthase